MKFPDVAGSVIQLLMDFLGDTSTASALDVIFFVREIVETNEKLRPAILARLLDSFTQIRSSRVRSCLNMCCCHESSRSITRRVTCIGLHWHSIRAACVRSDQIKSLTHRCMQHDLSWF